MRHQNPLPRRFALHRWYDLTEISGTGVVAYGTWYPSGRVTLAWCCSDIRSVTVYDHVADVERLHGHNGYTELLWIDEPHDTPRQFDRQSDQPARFSTTP